MGRPTSNQDVPSGAPARLGPAPDVYRPSLSSRTPGSTSARGDSSANARSSSALPHRADSSSVKAKPDSVIYRPAMGSRSDPHHEMQFRCGGGNGSLTADQDIKDLVDALTGAPLQARLGLYQCKRCKVFYQAHSFEVIQSENGGRCVSCQNTGVESVIGRQEQRGRMQKLAWLRLTTIANTWDA